jgi:signal transduction histidine kinase
MNVDIRTLLVVHSLVSAALASLMIAFWIRHRAMPGLALWALGTVLIGLATVSGALRGILPNALSIVAANGIAVLGLAAVWNGIRVFDGRPPRWGGAVLAAAATAAFVAYHSYVVDDILRRIVVVSCVFSACCGLCAVELIRGPGRHRQSGARLAAVLFLLLASSMALRAAATLLFPPPLDIFAPTTARGLHALVMIIGNILIVGGLLMMAAQRLQRQLTDRNLELEAAHARAEQASRAKSAFLATVSHELRTPLNAIIGFSDIQRLEIYGPLGHPRYREYADDIHASGTHLLDLITTILDISKSEASKLRVEPEWLDPRPVIEAAVRLVRDAAAAKQIALEVDLPATPLECFADPRALRQILLNLLSNAVKFTRHGAVTAELRPLPDQRIELVVRDTGIGIAAADLPRLMQPFEQATDGYARQNGGTGLGLPLVDSLVRLHGGEFVIDSTPGRGTAAIVRLTGQIPAALAAS